MLYDRPGIEPTTSLPHPTRMLYHYTNEAVPNDTTRIVENICLYIITLEYSSKLIIRLPCSLCDINVAKTKDTGKDFRSVVKSYDSYMRLVNEKLRIDPTFVRSKIFVHCIGNLVNLIGKHPNVK